MKTKKTLRERYQDFLLDHPILKVIFKYTKTLIGCFLVAFLIAYTHTGFVVGKTAEGYTLVGGGVTGFSQLVTLILQKCGWQMTMDEVMTVQSITYFAVNIPLFFLAFFKIGKRFAIITFINVIMTSLMIKFMPDFINNLFNINEELLTRAIFAGFIHGVGIAIASELNHSTGGTDIISTFFGLKKGIAIGKYVLIINGAIILIYTILSMVSTETSPSVEGAPTMALYTIIFFFVSSIVIDKISSRNKKVQLQIVTSEPRLAKVLIQNFPHGCTIIDGKGAYLDKEKKVIFTVLSAFEVKQATKIIYKIDPNAFITVTNAKKVFGKFFIKPMR